VHVSWSFVGAPASVHVLYAVAFARTAPAGQCSVAPPASRTDLVDGSLPGTVRAIVRDCARAPRRRRGLMRGPAGRRAGGSEAKVSVRQGVRVTRERAYDMPDTGLQCVWAWPVCAHGAADAAGFGYVRCVSRVPPQVACP